VLIDEIPFGICQFTMSANFVCISLVLFVSGSEKNEDNSIVFIRGLRLLYKYITVMELTNLATFKESRRTCETAC